MRDKIEQGKDGIKHFKKRVTQNTDHADDVALLSYFPNLPVLWIHYCVGTSRYTLWSIQKAVCLQHRVGTWNGWCVDRINAKLYRYEQVAKFFSFLIFYYVASCPDLNLTNGLISYSPMGTTILEGAVATHVCHEGYRLSSEVSRTCESDKSWSGKVITCQGNYEFSVFNNYYCFSVVRSVSYNTEYHNYVHNRFIVSHL